MLKFIVLADLHLVPEGDLANGLDTAGRVREAISHVNEHHGDADFCILAGDLADRGQPDAYRRLQGLIEPLTVPLHITLGNHDDRPAFLDIFSGLAAETGCIDKVIDLKGHRIVILDSSEPGRHEGVLTTAQLDWLAARLDEAADRPVIVVLHHNITDLHVQTDFIRLQQNGAFIDVLKAHPDIRQVISGHVHMTTSGTLRGIPFSTFAGAHYSIAPTLQSRSGPVPNLAPRLEGPGQYAVVLADEASTVVHFENFFDRHLVLPLEYFRWKGADNQ